MQDSGTQYLQRANARQLLLEPRVTTFSRSGPRADSGASSVLPPTRQIMDTKRLVSPRLLLPDAIDSDIRLCNKNQKEGPAYGTGGTHFQGHVANGDNSVGEEATTVWRTQDKNK